MTAPREELRRALNASKSAAPSESQLHRAVAGFLTARLLPPAFWTTFPAGGGGKMRGTFLKVMGLKAGVPDILLMRPVKIEQFYSEEWTTPFVGWIELKTKIGHLSQAQKICHADLGATGAAIAVCRSLEEVKAKLEFWEFPLRKVSAAQERLQLAIESWQNTTSKADQMSGWLKLAGER